MTSDGRYETAERFLQTVFGHVDGEALLIWTVKGNSKRSYWPKSIEAAAKMSVGFDQQTNVYVGCGWRSKPLGSYARGERADIAGISSLWIDLDVAGDGHGPKTYAPSFEHARSLVAGLPAPPTLTVNSGGGLHVWWVFKEPWIFANEDERTAAAALVGRWEATVRQHALEHGWTIDSVHDLPRVLRVPGTYRTKDGAPNPLLVEIESDNGCTYLPSDFEPFLVEEVSGRQIAAAGIEVGSLVLRIDAEPPVDKFQALLEIEPRFKATWKRQRQHGGDNSRSVVDLSLATFAAQVDWTDQEIANLLIAGRRESGEAPEKALRVDYIRDRIRHARACVADQQRKQEARAAKAVENVDTEQGLKELDEAVARGAGQTEVLAYVSSQLGVGVSRWTQVMRDAQAFYELHLAAGTVVPIGNVRSFTTPDSFRNSVISGASVVMPRFTRDKWDRIVRALTSIVEVVDVGQASRTGQLVEWLQGYLNLEKLPDLVEYDAKKIKAGLPFSRAGMIYVHVGNFLDWLFTRTQHDAPRKSEIMSLMRIIGFRPYKCSARDQNGRVVNKNYWRGPEGSLSDPDHGSSVSMISGNGDSVLTDK